MKAMVTCLLFGSLASCSAFDPQEVKDCQARLIASLKAPSTYKRISLANEIVTYEGPALRKVEIIYDAQNSYGVPLRQTRTCRFPLKGSQPDLVNYTDTGDGMAEPEQPVDNAAIEAQLRELKAVPGNVK